MRERWTESREGREIRGVAHRMRVGQCEGERER